MVAAEFPPVKGIGRLRPLKFCQHLKRFGWETAVLTVETGDIAPVDLRTLDEIPAGTQVFRARLPKPKDRAISALKKLMQRKPGQLAGAAEGGANGARRSSPGNDGMSLAGRVMGAWDAFARKYLEIPDDVVLWVGPAVRTGIEVVGTFKPDVILATAPHFTDLVVGARLSRATGVPWVADYRDLWTGDVLRDWVPLWRRRVEVAMERRLVSTARAIVTVSEPKTEVVRQRLGGLTDAVFLTLTNGYDVEEFEGVEPERPPGGVFRIVYAGRLFKNRRGYELLEAAGKLVASNGAYRDRFRLEYYGGVAPEIAARMAELSAKYDLGAIVQFFPDVSYARSKSLQKGADALLLIVDGGETTSGVIPGKLFEYVAAARPVLCIAAPGATTEIIECGRLGYTVAPGDVAALETALKLLMDGGQKTFAPDTEYLARFERGRVVESLAHLLDTVSSPAWQDSLESRT